MQIRIQEAYHNADQDSDPDPRHWLTFNSFYGERTRTLTSQSPVTSKLKARN